MKKINENLLNRNGRNSISLLSSIQNLTIGSSTINNQSENPIVASSSSSSNNLQYNSAHECIDGINSIETEINYKANQYTSLN